MDQDEMDQFDLSLARLQRCASQQDKNGALAELAELRTLLSMWNIRRGFPVAQPPLRARYALIVSRKSGAQQEDPQLKDYGCFVIWDGGVTSWNTCWD